MRRASKGVLVAKTSPTPRPGEHPECALELVGFESTNIQEARTASICHDTFFLCYRSIYGGFCGTCGFVFCVVSLFVATTWTRTHICKHICSALE